MTHAIHNAIVGFIWGIADDVLRDVYVRGKYRDVILPMIVIRRLDALLEPTREAVLRQKERYDKDKIGNQDNLLCRAAGQAFYNTAPVTLRDLTARTHRQGLKADFEAYLNGFSENVQEILDKFTFRNQIQALVDADILGHLIEKFLSNTVNLSPKPVCDAAGNELLPALDNHAMGTIFEELIRRFNEENNEEAGEHFTPRDVVTLMVDLIIRPVVDTIESGTYLVYDGACGTGGMLTVAEDRLTQLTRQRNKDASIHLYGQEIQPETYAICKADLLLKGEGQEANNIKSGSTISGDAFGNLTFDFMISNPPYGKSWKVELDRLGGKNNIRDPRFVRQYAGDPEYKMLPRSSDGQLLFLVNNLCKMKHDTKTGSHIAEIHNGSSLFTGDAGQGESNIRRWIIESDWLEAIVALPLNMFYNTGIATYIWIITNRKPAHRVGMVQLIDATQWHTPLRRNLGKKNCQLSAPNIKRIYDTFLEFKETDQSRILPNEAIGYRKVTIERPLRIAQLAPDTIHKTPEINKARLAYGTTPDAPPLIRKRHPNNTPPNPLQGRHATTIDGTPAVVEYEPDPELRDSEQIPLPEQDGIEGFLRREVLPYAPDAWYDPRSVKIGYEINFTRYFYRPQPMRTLDQIRGDIQSLETETEGLLSEIIR